MGAYCPAPLATPELMQQIEESVLVPTVHTMKRQRRPFHGLLYAGLMITNQGPRVLEFNCRFGDPETQPLLMRLRTDLLDLLEAVVDGRLDEFAEKGLDWDPRPAVCVVMCSPGYPGSYPKGKVIGGLDLAARMADVKVFHAGTRQERQYAVTDGGRVLGVTALGDTLAHATQRAYAAVEMISFPGAHYRRDIGATVAENKVHVHDFHATILHLLGIDHERLTYRHAGRDFRLTDVYGNVVRDILA
jgi:phosphoribosylamine--glycine ligase